MSNYLTLPLVCFAPSLFAKFHAKYAGILCLLYMIIIGMKFPLRTVLSVSAHLRGIIHISATQGPGRLHRPTSPPPVFDHEAYRCESPLVFPTSDDALQPGSDQAVRAALFHQL